MGLTWDLLGNYYGLVKDVGHSFLLNSLAVWDLSSSKSDTYSYVLNIGLPLKEDYYFLDISIASS